MKVITMGATARTEVLVIDDEEDVRTILDALLSHANYHVSTAENGDQAFRSIATKRPDLVLLDVEMPGMNGWQVLARIKSDALLRHLPVLMLTSKTQVPDKVYGLHLGANDYITKPFDPRELVARIESAVGNSRADTEANPLSLLPGNPAITREIENRIRSREKFAVLYADMNDFKAFNDRYGFALGDRAIRLAAQIMLGARKSGDFIGHVGGDDFVIVTTPTRAKEFSLKVISQFNAITPSLYDPEARKQGYIEVIDRAGNMTRFPLLTIAIGGVTNLQRALSSVGQISELGAEMKKVAKSSSPGYALDRRSNKTEPLD